MSSKPLIVAVGGFTSDVGKTTLVSELLRGLDGWEAIKVTRGHYRSCGKDPHACCVSHLLSDEPRVLSGRKETYTAGKDTGHYWDAGAANVHWVIATDAQVERGIANALARVNAPCVIAEGNSFWQFVEVDFAIMVARSEGGKIKPTARRALTQASAIYLSDLEGRNTKGATTGSADAMGSMDATMARARFAAWREASGDRDALEGLPVYTREDLPQLVARIASLREVRAA